MMAIAQAVDACTASLRLATTRQPPGLEATMPCNKEGELERADQPSHHRDISATSHTNHACLHHAQMNSQSVILQEYCSSQFALLLRAVESSSTIAWFPLLSKTYMPQATAPWT